MLAQVLGTRHCLKMVTEGQVIGIAPTESPKAAASKNARCRREKSRNNTRPYVLLWARRYGIL